VFIAERPPEQELQVVLGLRVDAAEAFKPPATGSVKRRFTKQHWGSLQMLLADPDGRVLGIEAPVTKAKGRKATVRKRAPRKAGKGT
jgi:hypothetical protein